MSKPIKHLLFSIGIAAVLLHPNLGAAIVVKIPKRAITIAGFLYQAAEKGRLDEVKRLINDVEDINSLGYVTSSLSKQACAEDTMSVRHILDYAVVSSCDSSATVEYLMGRGAMAEDGLILFAASSACYLNLRELLKGKIDINAHDERGRNALMRALPERYPAPGYRPMARYYRVSKLLIESGIELDARDCEGNTALIHAASRGYHDVARLLVEAGADLDIANKQGLTAFQLSYEAYPEIAELLFESGAHVPEDYLPVAYSTLGYFERLKGTLKSNVNFKTFNGDTALIAASRRGHTEVVKHLLHSNAEIGIRNASGDTALAEAVENDRSAVVDVLIGAGADVNAKDNSGRTVFFKVKSQCMAKRLMDAEADLNAISDDGYGPTALSEAVRRGDYELVKYMLERGARIHPSGVNRSPLVQASGERGVEHAGIVELLLERGAFTDKADGYSNRNALQNAAYRGSLSTVRMLLERGADVNFQDSSSRTASYTPLMYACLAKDFDKVYTLIENGANPSIRDQNGSTALIHASRRGGERIMSLLLQHGAKANDVDNLGASAFLRAIENGCSADVIKLLLGHGADTKIVVRGPFGCHDNALVHASAASDAGVVKLLMDYGHDVNARGCSGMTPLLSAVRSLPPHRHTADHEERVQVIRCLVDNGAALEEAGDAGLSPLMLAFENGDAEVVRLLIDKGADIHRKNKKGWSAIHYAARMGEKGIVNMLLVRGADIDAKDSDGNTPLAIAKRYGNKAVKNIIVAAGHSR